jgi:hypothetical protein
VPAKNTHPNSAAPAPQTLHGIAGKSLRDYFPCASELSSSILYRHHGHILTQLDRPLHASTRNSPGLAPYEKQILLKPQLSIPQTPSRPKRACMLLPLWLMTASHAQPSGHCEVCWRLVYLTRFSLRCLNPSSR